MMKRVCILDKAQDTRIQVLLMMNEMKIANQIPHSHICGLSLIFWTPVRYGIEDTGKEVSGMAVRHVFGNG